MIAYTHEIDAADRALALDQPSVAPEFARAEEPVLVLLRQRVAGEHFQQWSDRWYAVGRMAVRRPHCLAFRVLREVTPPQAGVVMMEWQSRAEFNRFVRESGLVWQVRAGTEGPHPVDTLIVSMPLR